MRQGKRIAVVIPALNEAPAIGKVLNALPHWLDHVVVADNGSTDGTAGISQDWGAVVATEPRRGYGGACLAGVAALPDTVDVLVFLDADYSDVPEQMEWLVDPILDDDADLVVGARKPADGLPSVLTLQQIFGNRLACGLIRLVWGCRFEDLGPFRAIRAQAYTALGMTDKTYGWTIEMQIKAVEQEFRVCEVPVSYRPRIGQSKISGTVGGVIAAGIKILSVITTLALRKFTRRLGGKTDIQTSLHRGPTIRVRDETGVH